MMYSISCRTFFNKKEVGDVVLGFKEKFNNSNNQFINKFYDKINLEIVFNDISVVIAFFEFYFNDSFIQLSKKNYTESSFFKQLEQYAVEIKYGNNIFEKKLYNYFLHKDEGEIILTFEKVFKEFIEEKLKLDFFKKNNKDNFKNEFNFDFSEVNLFFDNLYDIQVEIIKQKKSKQYIRNKISGVVTQTGSLLLNVTKYSVCLFIGLFVAFVLVRMAILSFIHINNRLNQN